MAAPRALDEAGQRALLRGAEASPIRARSLVILMLFTALRISEAVALDVDDVRILTRKGVLVVMGKGEVQREVPLNALIGSRAQIPADEDDHRRHALCLQILVNAVQIWNARYMSASIDHLHTAKPDVVADDHALTRVAPVTHAHINSLGGYDLDRQPPPPGQLRPLRRVDEDDRATPTPPLGVSGASA